MNERSCRLTCACGKVKMFVVLVVLAAAAIGSVYYFSFGKKKNRPNIVFLMLDTLRASHMGYYGFERDTSPFLDSFARENVAFSYAICSSPWTPPSVASMMTGLYASSHGLIPPNSREDAKKMTTHLNPDLLTLPEILKEAGYQTGAVSPNPWITPEFGFNQGYDSFDVMLRADAEKISAKGKELVEKFEKNKEPFFLYLHYLDVHQPYEPPEAYKGIFKEQPLKGKYDKKSLKRIDLYNGEIRYLDDQIKSLLTYFKEKGLYKDMLIVVVGDHGEQFKEHGNYGHGNQLYDEEIHVPFFIKTPDSLNKVITHPVSLVDIYPTVTALLKLKNPANLQGISLFDNKAQNQRSGVFSEIFRKYNQKSFVDSEGRKIIAGGRDMQIDIQSSNLDSVPFSIFNLKEDAAELQPMQNNDTANLLKDELKEILNSIAKVKPQEVMHGKEVEDSTLDQLESLGYLK